MIYRIITILIIGLSACSSQSSNKLVWADYSQWLQDHQDHFSKERSSKLIDIRSEFIPSGVLAYHELKNTAAALDQSSLDSVKRVYECGLSFKIAVTAADKQFNLLYYNLAGMTAYKQRVNELNFRIPEFIHLKVGGQNYEPVLFQFEGYNELSRQLIFHLVFDPPEFNCGAFTNKSEKIRLTFEDPYWGSGINHFTYKTQDINNIPKLIASHG